MVTTAGGPAGAHDLQGLTVLDHSKSTRGREGLSAPGSRCPTTSAPSSSLTQPQPRHLKKGRSLPALCRHAIGILSEVNAIVGWEEMREEEDHPVYNPLIF